MEIIEIKLNRRDMACLMQMLCVAVETDQKETKLGYYCYFVAEKVMMEAERLAHFKYNWCRNKNCDLSTRILDFIETYKPLINEDEELAKRYLQGVFALPYPKGITDEKDSSSSGSSQAPL